MLINHNRSRTECKPENPKNEKIDYLLYLQCLSAARTEPAVIVKDRRELSVLFCLRCRNDKRVPCRRDPFAEMWINRRAASVSLRSLLDDTKGKNLFKTGFLRNIKKCKSFGQITKNNSNLIIKMFYTHICSVI
jgi:hypothetical protein